MEPSKRSPKLVRAEYQDGWQDCRLEIKRITRRGPEELSPRALDVMRDQRSRRPGGQGAEPGTLQAFEIEIELLTGRTHQIRAQLSALACPLVGDEMYGDSGAVEQDSQAKDLARKMEVEGTLALQANYISFQGLGSAQEGQEPGGQEPGGQEPGGQGSEGLETCAPGPSRKKSRRAEESREIAGPKVTWTLDSAWWLQPSLNSQA
eukprot:CAMPEP_0184329720 /NCGR_PEP_ID=MMETSP1049-20130417/144295_1 /TAXON_ID=77928 /ORGANISM="Proteomonas sulcata, Strain CCMP704" /LENGTH=205 /DNA_ID=CAMNT_0026652103 /DNA_START=406 /DNA_END=1023 /DNA_ORIENTATION=+